MAIHLPKQFVQIPRVRLLYPDPSPIHPLPALTTSLNSNSNSNTTESTPRPHISLYTKREDHSSPLACAGNKYRKLEYIIPDILNPTATTTTTSNNSNNIPFTSAAGGPTAPGKVTTLVTEGAVQSNHTIQVASVARKLGLESVAILHKGSGGGLASAADKDAFLRVGNVQIAKLLGTEVRMLEKKRPSQEQREQQQQFFDPVAEVMEELAARGKVPYWIPSGASLHPLGGLGYARCAFEIAAQEQSESHQLPGTGRFDYIFVACGSGSTVGGLIAGFKLLEKQQPSNKFPPRKVIGIINSPTKPLSWHQDRVLRFARTAGRMIGLDPENDITMADVILDNRYAGTAYGVLDAQTKETLEMVARQESVVLDPVYTAKVVRGMVEGWVRQGELGRDWASRVEGLYRHQANVLFVHTGGQSALGAYAVVE